MLTIASTTFCVRPVRVCPVPQDARDSGVAVAVAVGVGVGVCVESSSSS